MVFEPPTFGTKIPPIPGQAQFEAEKKEREELRRIKCIDSGGEWDPVTKTCKLPTKEEEKKEVPPQAPPKAEKMEAPKEPQIFRTKEGEARGILMPDGTMFMGEPEEIRQLAEKQRLKRAPIPGTVEVKEAIRQADIEERQRILQETGAPVRRELDPTLEPGETFPLVGPLIVKTRKEVYKRARPWLRKIFDESEASKFFELQPEQLKTIALSEIERIEIERGLTDSEKFGSIMESLGLGGLSNFAAEKPSENVQTILRELKTMKTRATNAEIKVKDGTWRQVYGQEVIDGIKNDIQRMESRMKMLIQDSPELKFNSDGVNFIETKILEARERLFAAEINILSGPAQDPSEIQVLMSLQESIQQEEFEI